MIMHGIDTSGHSLHRSIASVPVRRALALSRIRCFCDQHMSGPVLRRLGFIGCGMMAQAMIPSIVATGVIQADNVIANDLNPSGASGCLSESASGQVLRYPFVSCSQERFWQH